MLRWENQTGFVRKLSYFFTHLSGNTDAFFSEEDTPKIILVG